MQFQVITCVFLQLNNYPPRFLEVLLYNDEFKVTREGLHPEPRLHSHFFDRKRHTRLVERGLEEARQEAVVESAQMDDWFPRARFSFLLLFALLSLDPGAGYQIGAAIHTALRPRGISGAAQWTKMNSIRIG
jgi:hypothetical protein